jgi:hypothetical protein
MGFLHLGGCAARAMASLGQAVAARKTQGRGSDGRIGRPFFEIPPPGEGDDAKNLKRFKQVLQIQTAKFVRQ